MRNLTLKLSLLTLAVSMQLAAADLFLGTWKLDPSRSKYEPGPVPMSFTTVYSAEGDWIVIKNKGIDAEGNSTSSSNRYKRDGKDYPWNVAEGGNMTISLKLTNDHASLATIKRDGKPASTSKTTISKDGKTRTIISEGVNANGKKFLNVGVFNRQ